ncbi:MAG: glycosyltransferase family 39 protein [Patescibacteria group bacterium]
MYIIKKYIHDLVRAPIFWIIVLALIMRLPGILYGLPLWLFGDEPSLILAALKMIQLRTLVPAFHVSEFWPLLYYPPYLAYIYLPFFSLVAVLKFISFGTNLDIFQNLIASNVSSFFIVARFLNVIFAAVSIFLIYRTAESLLKNRIGALAAAFLVSTSMLHVMLSFTARHWLAVFTLLSTVLYFLSHEKLKFKQRYFFATVAAGFSIGVSTIGIINGLLIILWYLCIDRRTLLSMLREKIFYQCLVVFLGLAILPIILYPLSFGFAPDTTIHGFKNLVGALLSPINFLQSLAVSEPIIMSLFVVGLFALFKMNRRLFITFVTFVFAYSLIFYAFFRFEHRFILPLMAIIAIVSGLGFQSVFEILSRHRLRWIGILLLIIPLFFTTRMALLASRNDSRVLAMRYLEQVAPSGERVIVYANLMRLPTTKEAIIEQTVIDSKSLRTVDRAEAELPKEYRSKRVFHALNLYTVSNTEFYNNIEDYVRKNDYRYLIVATKDFLNNQTQTDKVLNLRTQGELVAVFGSEGGNYSIAESDINGNPFKLFALQEFGPRIEIYRMNYEIRP